MAISSKHTNNHTPRSSSLAFRGKEEPTSLRFTTPMHLDWKPIENALSRFRVMAVHWDGPCQLVAMGRTRAEAVAVARQNRCELDPDVVGFRVQYWEGTATEGRWQDQPRRRGEFPSLADLRRHPAAADSADRRAITSLTLTDI